MTLIDTAMAAAMLRCSRFHVTSLVARGVLHNHGTPRRIRLDLSEISAAIEAGTVTPEPKRGRRIRHSPS